METDDYIELIDRKWTAGELCEFLGLTVEQIVNAFPKRIEKNWGAILEELGYDIEDDEAEL